MIIACQECGSEFMHIEKAKIFQTNDDYLIDGHFEVDKNLSFTYVKEQIDISRRARELSFIFVFTCEKCNNEDHRSLSFHKGQYEWL